MRVGIEEFALEVSGPEELPAAFRPVYLGAPREGVCRQAVFAPRLGDLPRRYGRAAASHLLMLFDQRLLIAAGRAGEPVVTYDVPLEDVLCVEIGEALLCCRMRVVFGRAVCEEVVIPFNLVRAALFREALSLMRRALDARPGAGVAHPPTTTGLDFKFANVLRQWMGAGEVALGYAFQPEVRARRLRVFGRQAAPALLAALTDRQLMLVSEEPPAAKEQMGRFTEVYTYCPLSRVDTLEVIPGGKAGGLAVLRLSLVNGTARHAIDSKVSKRLAPEFERLSRGVNDRVRTGTQVVG